MEVAALNLENGFIPGFYTGSDMYLESVGGSGGFPFDHSSFSKGAQNPFQRIFRPGTGISLLQSQETRPRRISRAKGNSPHLPPYPVSPSISQSISHFIRLIFRLEEPGFHP